MAPNSSIPLQPPSCNCAMCRSLFGARAALAAVTITATTNSQVEAHAAQLVYEAERMLSAAQSILLQQHMQSKVSPLALSHYTSNELQRVAASGGIDEDDDGDRTPRISPTKTSLSSSSMGSPAHEHERLDNSPGSALRPSGTSPTKPPSRFEATVRSRAAELGILRGSTNVSPTDNDTIDLQQNLGLASPSSARGEDKRSKFIVCDHCRSHGIRCNEASVCKECIMREVPCIHRMCELSPKSKEHCPRQVCFYVHEDYMPDVYGNHNPNDQNWLILPGKVRERLSAGQLSKQVSQKSEAEVFRCYQGVATRQQQARETLTGLVQAGAATWENVNMACNCQAIDFEEQRTRAVEEKLRRLNIPTVSI